MLKKTLYTILAGIIIVFFHIGISNAQTLNIVKNGNLRSGPSTKDKVVGKVTAGQEVTQIEKSGDWYKVKLPKGQLGWVNKILVSEKTAAKSAGTKAPLERPAERKIDVSTLGPAAPMNFSPVAGLMLGLFKVSSHTRCSIMGDTLSTTWQLVLNYSDDVIEYAKGKNGPGNPTGKVIYFNKDGGMDPLVTAMNDQKGNSIIPNGKNLIQKIHQSGASYRIWNSKMPGVYGPLSPMHLPGFLGIGSTVRFPSDNWILFGDKQYRYGGFVVTQLSIEFLPLTEVKSSFGTFLLYEGQWRKIKSQQ